MASARAFTVRRGVAIAFFVVAALAVAAASTGEPDQDPEVGSSSANIVGCIMGCATEMTGCETACASDPSVACAQACVQRNLSCLGDCGIVPSPPAA